MKSCPRKASGIRRLLSTLLAAALIPAFAQVVSAAAPGANTGVPGTPYRGFGRHTTGGEGKPVYRVTTLNDAGPGSLRDAVSRGDRWVVFDVAGEIVLQDKSGDLQVKGGNLTIDGFTAPAPGITLRKFGVVLSSGNGANNVIVRGIRIYESDQRAADDPAGKNAVGCGGGVIMRGVHNVVIDHVSTGLNGNFSISVTRGAYDVTISNTLQFENHNINLPSYRMLSAVFGPISPRYDPTTNDTRRISYYHNLVMNGSARHPKISYSAAGMFQAREITADVRNNLIWNFDGSGTDIEDFSLSNVVNNYYFSATTPEKAITVDSTARTHVSGNVSGNGVPLNGRGSEAQPFLFEPVDETDAGTAAAYVRANAGARCANFGLSALDREHIDQIPTRLPIGPATPSPTTLSRTRLAIGNRVESTNDINVHSSPAMNSRSSLPTFLATQRKGTKGTILAGPRLPGGNWWYQVNFDSGEDGWVLGLYLQRAAGDEKTFTSASEPPR